MLSTPLRFATVAAVAVFLSALLFFVGRNFWRNGDVAGIVELHFASGAVLMVPYVDDPVGQAHGLAGRWNVGPGLGFEFSPARQVAFWMKETPVSLSVAFFRDGHVIGLADMQPNSLEKIPSPGPIDFALEVPVGWFSAHGVTSGTLVQVFPR